MNKITNKKERILSPIRSLSSDNIKPNIILMLTEPIILPEWVHVIISDS